MGSINRTIIETLIEAGIDHIFTLPGGAVSPVFPDLHAYQYKIKVVLARNEQTASCMAVMKSEEVITAAMPSSSANEVGASIW